MELLEKIKNKASGTLRINQEEPLRVAGIDSLNMMVFLLELEEVTNQNFGAVDIKTHDSLEKIYTFYASQQ